jgi:hypothetical protein
VCTRAGFDELLAKGYTAAGMTFGMGEVFAKGFCGTMGIWGTFSAERKGEVK